MSFPDMVNDYFLHGMSQLCGYARIPDIHFILEIQLWTLGQEAGYPGSFFVTFVRPFNETMKKGRRKVIPFL
jgi:hypothetical protein